MRTPNHEGLALRKHANAQATGLGVRQSLDAIVSAALSYLSTPRRPGSRSLSGTLGHQGAPVGSAQVPGWAVRLDPQSAARGGSPPCLSGRRLVTGFDRPA